MPRLPNFPTEPTPAKVGDYLAALMNAESEGDLDDDEWLDGLAAVRDWLQAWPFGWKLTAEEEAKANARRAEAEAFLKATDWTSD